MTLELSTRVMLEHGNMFKGVFSGVGSLIMHKRYHYLVGQVRCMKDNNNMYN